jgi:hypothetical protein
MPAPPAIVPELLMPPEKVPTPVTTMPVAATEIVPELLMPPPALGEPKLWTPVTAMPAPPAIVPELLMLAEKVLMPATKMPAAPVPAEIVPELLMPPEKVPTPVTTMPVAPTAIVPELLMPPETTALLVTMIPTPDGDESAVIEPLFTIAPLIVLLAMVMPVPVGGAVPVVVMEPPAWLVTLPLTVEF